MGAAAWLLGGALLARGASTPLPLHGVAARAELVPLLSSPHLVISGAAGVHQYAVMPSTPPPTLCPHPYA